jgi:hypothetical protein
MGSPLTEKLPISSVLNAHFPRSSSVDHLASRDDLFYQCLEVRRRVEFILDLPPLPAIGGLCQQMQDRALARLETAQSFGKDSIIGKPQVLSFALRDLKWNDLWGLMRKVISLAMEEVAPCIVRLSKD